MTADTTPPTPPEATSDAAVAAPSGDTATTPGPMPVTTQDDEETTTLWRQGLPADAVVLAPSIAATPMRQPENTWAMLVLAADVMDDTDPDREGEVALFAGCWLPGQPQAAMCEEDLVLVLTAPDGESPPDDQVDVEMLLAHGSQWLRVGEWKGADPRWPWTVAVTAAAIMGRCVETTEAATLPPNVTVDRPLQGWGGKGGLVDLLAAGLLQAGEEFIWDRPARGTRHTAHIHPNGTLVLADGRAYHHPSGAIAALGGKNMSGWRSWKRTSDRRTLSDLRTELRAHRGQAIEPHRGQ
ncbi:hypothetical protein F4560_008643 [Saccharothrix ecbatanensis]|uniref:RAMA domain-containing protein n=1 Tax=Saccharothrix ecbatanensis TaxID=1105145 RepID=A0A7W9HUV2_9PSEU|nr:hypothetical protein [Saccharothrix ecbatanensis]MBB5808875.1 hypothetical protein [Saccharothrix ecbatanensis]